eukprot:2645187-Amphidinium_carterae.1
MLFHPPVLPCPHRKSLIPTTSPVKLIFNEKAYDHFAELATIQNRHTVATQIIAIPIPKN